MNNTARSKLDILYQEVLGEVSSVINKVEKLQVELPASIENAADAAAARFESAGTKQIELAASRGMQQLNDTMFELRQAASSSIESVAVANRNAEAGKWIAVGAGSCLAFLLVGSVGGWWLANSSYQVDLQAMNSVLATDEGRAGIQLARLGQAQMLLNCSGEGWQVNKQDSSNPIAPNNRVCFPMPSNRGVRGWIIEHRTD